MKILTGNDLKSGDVIWWTGSDWSRRVEDAKDVGDEGSRVLAEEEAAGRVNASYIVEAELTPEGPRPNHIKDRVRALGPTVRMDLTLKPNDAQASARIL